MSDDEFDAISQTKKTPDAQSCPEKYAQDTTRGSTVKNRGLGSREARACILGPCLSPASALRGRGKVLQHLCAMALTAGGGED